MSTIFDEQLIAAEVISRLKDRFDEVIVAGGAARDWFRGNLCRDIDIYCVGIGVPMDVPYLLREFNPRQLGEAYDGSQDSGISSVWDMSIDGKSVQVMTGTLAGELHTLLNFPASSSQISWAPFLQDPRLDFIHTDYFLEGERSRKVVINSRRCSAEFFAKTLHNNEGYEVLEISCEQGFQNREMSDALGLLQGF